MFHLPTMASHVWVFSILITMVGPLIFPWIPSNFSRGKKKEESHELSDKSHEQRFFGWQYRHNNLPKTRCVPLNPPPVPPDWVPAEQNAINEAASSTTNAESSRPRRRLLRKTAVASTWLFVSQLVDRNLFPLHDLRLSFTLSTFHPETNLFYSADDLPCATSRASAWIWADT